MASGNNEISNFSEIPTKPIDTKMMTTSNLPSESPTEVLFPPFPSELLNRLSSTIALLIHSSVQYRGSITTSVSVSISTGKDPNVFQQPLRTTPSQLLWLCLSTLLPALKNLWTSYLPKWMKHLINFTDYLFRPMTMIIVSKLKIATCYNPDSVPSFTLIDTSSTATD